MEDRLYVDWWIPTTAVSAHAPPPGRSKVKLFGPLPPIDGALSGKTGLHIKLPFFFGRGGGCFEFSWRSVLYSSDMGSRPVPQKLRLN